MLRCQEFLPDPALREVILYYGVLEDNETYLREKVDVTPPVINKGFMFHYRRDNKLITDNGHFAGELPRGFILPQGNTTNVWRHRGGFGIFSIIFKPGMFRYLYREAMLEHLNGAPTYEDFNDPSLSTLIEQILTAERHRQRIQLANNFFLKKIRYADLADDPMMKALRKMYLHPCYNVQQVREHIYLSEGHFRRLFSRTFGISPKKMQTLIRLTHAINHLSRKPADNLAQISLACGFADQAHFANKFKAYTGLTPLAFKQQQLNLTRMVTNRDEINDGYFR